MDRGRLRAALVALPFVGAMVFLSAQVFGGSGGPVRQALADADAGTYAIAIRDDGEADTVLAVGAANGDVLEVAEIAHLPGYASFGAVSPDGGFLAVVVADGGTPAKPIGSLHIVDLQSGAVRSLLGEIDQLQQPAWAPDGRSVIVTRTAAVDSPATTVSVLAVGLDGAVAPAMEISGVAGAYPAGFDASGRLLVAAIDAGGTTLYRQAAESIRLSEHITRDWKVSPDGTQIAFIEADASDGLRYRARVVDLAGGLAQAQSALADEGQQLGVAWHPGDHSLAVGDEPGTGGARAASATGGGFDIPLGYSPEGAFLAVEAWSGTSFADPGSVALEVLGPGGRVTLPGANRFAGWAAR